MTNADLAGANLTNADLTATKVDGTNFLEAIMPDGTKWRPNVDIQKFVNLKNNNVNWENYPHTIVVQLRTSGGILGLGRIDELAFRHKYEIKLGNLLMKHEIGACDGGQSGAGTSEVFLYTNDIEVSVDIILNYLETENLLPFMKIVSRQSEATEFTVHYPKDSKFNFFEF